MKTGRLEGLSTSPSVQSQLLEEKGLSPWSSDPISSLFPALCCLDEVPGLGEKDRGVLN